MRERRSRWRLELSGPLAGVAKAVHEHGEDAGGVKVAESGEDPVSTKFGVSHVALGVLCSDFQLPVLRTAHLERVRAENGSVGARNAEDGAGAAAVGVAVCGGKSLHCASVGGVAKANDLERVTSPATAEHVVPKRVGAAGNGGIIAATAAASAGPLGREQARHLQWGGFPPGLLARRPRPLFPPAEPAQ